MILLKTCNVKRRAWRARCALTPPCGWVEFWREMRRQKRASTFPVVRRRFDEQCPGKAPDRFYSPAFPSNARASVDFVLASFSQRVAQFMAPNFSPRRPIKRRVFARLRRGCLLVRLKRLE
jgi:hypothetical protein